jgi:LmbE family N-acetylglucosaminyl deacetylase
VLHLLISPHLDDAVLSCGAFVSRATALGDKAVIATVFAGDPSSLPPLAKKFHERWSIGQSIEQRKIEDAAACKGIGASLLHLGFEDAIYRSSENEGVTLYDSVASLYEEYKSSDEAMLHEIYLKLQALMIEFQPDAVYGPAAIGNHVDHVLTRISLETTITTCPKSSEARLFLYEDLPYAARTSSNFQVENGEAVLQLFGRRDWHRKVRALEKYKSQLSMLWPNANYCVELRSYAKTFAPQAYYAERFWRSM